MRPGAAAFSVHIPTTKAVLQEKRCPESMPQANTLADRPRDADALPLMPCKHATVRISTAIQRPALPPRRFSLDDPTPELTIAINHEANQRSPLHLIGIGAKTMTLEPARPPLTPGQDQFPVNDIPRLHLRTPAYFMKCSCEHER